jgi:hydrogenase expression/formation protein HypC
MKIISRAGEFGTVEAGSLTYPVSLRLLPEAGIGDYVLVHAGFAIQKLDVADAEESIRLIREMEALAEQAEET